MATATAEKTDKNVEAKPRQSGGKNDARRLRKSGLIPAVLYGAGLEPLNLAVDPKQISRILHSEQGHNTIFDMAAGGDSGKVMIVDWQYEPIKGALLHVDLKRIAMDKLLQRQRADHAEGRSSGREAAGRRSGADAARGGDRVPAGRHSGTHRCRRQPDGVRPDVARCRSAAQRQDQVHHRREPGSRSRHGGEGSCCSRLLPRAPKPRPPLPSPKSSRRASRKPKAKLPRAAPEGREV